MLPWGKYEYQKLSMGVYNSRDIFLEKITEISKGSNIAHLYIYDLL